MSAADVATSLAGLADAERAAALLRPHLAELVGGERRVGALEVLHAWRRTHARAGRAPHLEVCYRLAGDSPDAEPVLLHGRAAARDAARCRDTGAWPRRIEVAPGVDLELRRFPDDPGLPQLTGLMALSADDSALPPAVARALGRGRGVHIEVVAYRPGRRCTLRLQRVHASGVRRQPSVFAKAYADGAALQVAALLDHLASCGEPPALPALLGCDAAGEVLWLRGEQGRTLHGCLGTPAQTPAIAAITTALARLHRCAPPAGRVAPLTRTRLLHEAQKKVAKLHTAAVGGAAELDRLLTGCARRLQHLPAHAPALVHGDAHCSQFLVRGRRALLLDFDELALADPELDLSRLLIDIELAAHDARARRAAVEKLLDAHDACARRAADADLLDWYCRLQLVDRAYRDFWRRGSATACAGSPLDDLLQRSLRAADGARR